MKGTHFLVSDYVPFDLMDMINNERFDSVIASVRLFELFWLSGRVIKMAGEWPFLLLFCSMLVSVFHDHIYTCFCYQCRQCRKFVVVTYVTLTFRAFAPFVILTCVVSN